MISDVFIRRPVTSIVISLLILLVGVLAMMNLPVTLASPAVINQAVYHWKQLLT